MDKRKVLREAEAYVRNKLAAEHTGHDWWHIHRVLNNATEIAKKEKSADLFIVQLGALFHDIADWKFNKGDMKLGGKMAERWLRDAGIEPAAIKKVTHIVDNVSFKGTGTKSTMRSLEGRIVQDADRLDAIGAIGIARAFAYGGHRGRPIYDPEGKTKRHTTFAQYKKGADSSLHHFYEKLLHLKKLMNTGAGKRMAAKRHAFLASYLKEFHAEWNGIK